MSDSVSQANESDFHDSQPIDKKNADKDKKDPTLGDFSAIESEIDSPQSAMPELGDISGISNIDDSAKSEMIGDISLLDEAFAEMESSAQHISPEADNTADSEIPVLNESIEPPPTPSHVARFENGSIPLLNQEATVFAEMLKPSSTSTPADSESLQLTETEPSTPSINAIPSDSEANLFDLPDANLNSNISSLESELKEAASMMASSEPMVNTESETSTLLDSTTDSKVESKIEPGTESIIETAEAIDQPPTESKVESEIESVILSKVESKLETNMEAGTSAIEDDSQPLPQSLTEFSAIPESTIESTPEMLSEIPAQHISEISANDSGISQSSDFIDASSDSESLISQTEPITNNDDSESTSTFESIINDISVPNIDDPNIDTNISELALDIESEIPESANDLMQSEFLSESIDEKIALASAAHLDSEYNVNEIPLDALSDVSEFPSDFAESLLNSESEEISTGDFNALQNTEFETEISQFNPQNEFNPSSASQPASHNIGIAGQDSKQFNLSIPFELHSQLSKKIDELVIDATTSITDELHTQLTHRLDNLLGHAVEAVLPKLVDQMANELRSEVNVQVKQQLPHIINEVLNKTRLQK